jgi:hypothetical protein
MDVHLRGRRLQFGSDAESGASCGLRPTAAVRAAPRGLPGLRNHPQKQVLQQGDHAAGSVFPQPARRRHADCDFCPAVLGVCGNSRGCVSKRPSCATRSLPVRRLKKEDPRFPEPSRRNRKINMLCR